MDQVLEFGRVVDSEDGLAGLYRPPGKAAVNKVRTLIDDGTAAFIDHCTFFVLSTSSATGRCDASPRGGPAGFLQRIGDRHIAFADLNGNNRLDSFRNIVANPYVGMLLMVPGKDETVRDLREGRVYDREAGTLLPPGSGPLPVGSLYWNGEWDDLTLAPDEVAAMRPTLRHSWQRSERRPSSAGVASPQSPTASCSPDGTTRPSLRHRSSSRRCRSSAERVGSSSASWAACGWPPARTPPSSTADPVRLLQRRSRMRRRRRER